MNPRDRRNVACHTAGEALWGAQSNLVAPTTVLTVVLLSFGASNATIGMIDAITVGLHALPQIIGAYAFRHIRKRKQLLLMWHWLCILPFAFASGITILLADRMSDLVVRVVLLSCYAGMVFAGGTIAAVWMDWMGRVYRTNIRGTAVGIIMAASSIAGTVGAAAAGYAITRWERPDVFGWLHIVAGSIGVIAITLFWLIRDPLPEQGDIPPPVLNLREMLQRFVVSLKDVNFRAFLIGRFLAAYGFCVVPFFVVHFTSKAGGSMDSGRVVFYSAVLPFATAFASLAFGRMGDRMGHRAGIMIGAATQVLTLMMILVGQGDVFCLIAFAGAGICMGAARVSHYNLLMETCPHDSHLSHITVGNLVMSFCSTPAPLLGGLIAGMWGTRVLFVVCIGFSLAALLWFIFRMREPRTLQAYPQATE